MPPDANARFTVPSQLSSDVVDEILRVLRSGGESAARSVAAMAASHLIDRVARVAGTMSSAGFVRIASSSLELLALGCGVEPRSLPGIDPVDPRSAFFSSLTPGEVDALGDALMVHPAAYVAALRVVAREGDSLDLESIQHLESAVGSADQAHASLARKILLAVSAPRVT